jgi:hypothetical protein
MIEYLEYISDIKKLEIQLNLPTLIIIISENKFEMNFV